MKTSFEFYPTAMFHLGLLVCASVVLIRRAPLEALYLHAGLWTGLALVVVQMLKLGVTVPPRAFIFAWVFYSLIAVRAAEILSRQPGLAGRMARNAVVLVAACYLVLTGRQYSEYRAWQSETRMIATAIATADGPAFVIGNPMSLASAQKAHLQTGVALTSRLQHLTGRHLVFCELEPEACRTLGDQGHPSDTQAPATLSVEHLPFATVIQVQ